MILRFLADADLNGAIVSGCVRRATQIDFKRAEEVPLEGLHDDTVLGIAAADGRVLVSHDVSTMPDHFREYIRRRRSPGVILVPQDLSIGKGENILLSQKPATSEILANRICLVPSLVIYGF